MKRSQGNLDEYSLQAEGWQIFRFALVGGMSTLTHMGVITFLYFLGGGRYILLANFCAWLVAFFVSFFGHQHVTFRRRTSLWRFLLMSLTGLGINYAVLTALMLTPVPDLPALLGAVAFAAVGTYWLARRHTFSF